MTIPFTFDEICIINIILLSNNKNEVLNCIDNYIKYSEDDELTDALSSLYQKINELNSKDLQKLYYDKCQNKISTCPMYELKI